MVTMERIDAIRAVIKLTMKNARSPSMRRAKAMEGGGIGVLTIHKFHQEACR